MNRSDTDQPNLRMPHDGQDHSRVNRGIRLPSCVSSVEVNLEVNQSPTVTVPRSRINGNLRLASIFSSGLASAISIFFIGLVSGAAGGLLLGATAVVVLQSLELLADNRLLMDQLENYTMAFPYKEKGTSVRTNNELVLNNHISLLVEEFATFSSTLSLAVGMFIGLSTYKLVIKKYGEAAMGKAFALAGPVCLTSVTATGYILGRAFKGFLSIASSVTLYTWFFIIPFSLVLTIFSVLPFSAVLCSYSNQTVRYTVWLFKPSLLFTILLIDLFSITKLILMVGLFPMLFSLIPLNTRDFQLTIVPIALMLIVTDIFNVAEQPIVTLQSPTSTNTSSAVLEGMFVGVLTSQMGAVVIGMSLFVSWQSGGAGKTCASAAASGGAVLGAIKLALPVLGPGPTIGALMGVAGAVGVSLSAAGAATNCYGQAVGHYGWVGWVGVTVGAAVGAFLSSCAHSGLSGMFMGLCAAMIPAGLKLLILSPWEKFQLCFYIIITICFLIWLYLTCTLACAAVLFLITAYTLIGTVVYGFIQAFKFLHSKCNSH
ncbi:uncharacterized protein LOC121199884 isoform X2 [Toxotes jaculatrix]|uniref:uncharacterized protein LOC121199884 isoform X2 n=1 Tax=Toxotes jaculatrix TaxID=941984 RepID=UPI001B3A8A93|nr:uncharacterized protein LOC121199884 isoform X2 [Toxotes jaculatrix]